MKTKMAELPPPKVSNLMIYKHKKIIKYFRSTKNIHFLLSFDVIKLKSLSLFVEKKKEKKKFKRAGANYTKLDF